MRNPPIVELEYRCLGDVTYHVVADPAKLDRFLRFWLRQEWEADHAEAPEEGWTVEWLNLLPRLQFSLRELDLDAVRPRQDLMDHHMPGYSFRADLEERAAQCEQGMLRGVSIEPLVVRQDGFELMDGYTRFVVLRKYRQARVYAYVGATGA